MVQVIAEQLTRQPLSFLAGVLELFLARARAVASQRFRPHVVVVGLP